MNTNGFNDYPLVNYHQKFYNPIAIKSKNLRSIK